MFLSTGLQAFADAEYEELTDVYYSALGSWSYAKSPILFNPAGEHQNNGTKIVENQGTVDIIFRRTVTLNRSDYNVNYLYFGYVYVSSNIEYMIWVNNYSLCNVGGVEYLGTDVSIDNVSIVYEPQWSMSYGDAGSSYFNNTAGTLTFNPQTTIYIKPQQFVGSNTFTIEYKFRVYFNLMGVFNGVPEISVSHTFQSLNNNVQSRIFRTSSDLYYLSNFDVEGIKDIIENDTSNISDNVNSAASSAAAAELAADTAISSALPSADAQLDSIADYDYNSIATNNTTALSFWKSLGDWLLSNSNLVGIGALLIGCLFIGFVVYLLRL